MRVIDIIKSHHEKWVAILFVKLAYIGSCNLGQFFALPVSGWEVIEAVGR